LRIIVDWKFLLKKPDGTNFAKKNIIHPFEDPSSLEFFSEKQDASLFVVGSHSKKRPNNLTFARMFDHKLLDMMEFGVLNYRPCSEFKVTQANSRSIPSFGLRWADVLRIKGQQLAYDPS
jgi:ribosome production factor 2